MSAYFWKKFGPLNTKFRTHNTSKGVKIFKSYALELMKSEFGEVITTLPAQEVGKLYKALMTIVFSHRYNKQDPILLDIDFTNIWGILYFYTTEIRNKYMED